jgi:hypothetical protein
VIQKPQRAIIMRYALFAAIVFSTLMLPLPTQAQGCALCYTQAANSGNRMIQALKEGIVILVIPPMLLSLGVAYLVYQKRNQFREAGGGEQTAPDARNLLLPNRTLTLRHGSTILSRYF